MLEHRSGRVLALCGAIFLVGCSKPAPPTPEVRPVRALTVQGSAGGERVSLTGQIRAQDQASLAFRVDGRLIERRVNVGDAVQPGQIIGNEPHRDFRRLQLLSGSHDEADEQQVFA